MLRNYLQVALRNMRRNRLYPLVNLLGLSIALACAILIATYARHELSYENFVPDVDRVFRVTQRQADNYFLGSNEFTVTQAGLAAALRNDVPEVRFATVFNNSPALVGTSGGFSMQDGLFADEQFFSVFGTELTAGDAASGLSAPENIVVSQSLARRLFGDADAIGRDVELLDVGIYTVTGVFRDVPDHTHLRYDWVASILGNDQFRRNLDEWTNSSYLTYLRLHDLASREDAAESIQALVVKYDMADSPADKQLNLQPISSIHLRSHINFELSANGDIRYVYLLLGIGVVILVLACVNYVNLAVTRSVQRAREVGVRKVVGASRIQIVRQFLGESMLMAVLSIALSLVFVLISLPVASQVAGRRLSILAGGGIGFLTTIAVFLFVVGILGGLYPSLVASRMRPSAILKGSGRSTASGGRLRTVLVAVQFCVSIALLSATLIMMRQMRFVRTTDVGYERARIVTARLSDRALRKRVPQIRSILLRNPHVVAVAGSGHLPTNIQSSTTIHQWTDAPDESTVKVYQNAIDYDFLDLYGIDVVEGRGFDQQHPSDTLGAYVINQTAFNRFGWDDVQGKFLRRSGRDREVVGVVHDFNMHSLHMEIEPLMFYLRPSNVSQLSIKLDGAQMQETLAFVQSELQNLSEYPATLKFVDESFEELYANDLRLERAIGIFMAFAVVLCALGLFGLVAFSVETRTKEIGIRKAVGSSVSGVVLLFGREYARLIVVAAALGIPAAYITVDAWLSRFAYRINLSPIDFIAALVLLFLVAGCSISIQTIRAARTDPVRALRYE